LTVYLVAQSERSDLLGLCRIRSCMLDRPEDPAMRKVESKWPKTCCQCLTALPPLTERRVLVTGGAGFIGSHLCERLLERGDEVLCVDNFYTGTRRNVQHLLSNPSFEVMRHDVCFPLYVEVDEILNLACPASPVHYQFDPVQTTKVSVHGSINMLGLAKRVKAKVLQASTSEVYGDPTVHPQKEDYWGNVNPIGLRSCYDETVRGNLVLRLSAPASSADQGCTDFQYLWSWYASKRRARRIKFHYPSPAQ
jgi:GDP-mannose 4,6 dehydratase